MEQLVAEARAQSTLSEIRQVAPPSRPLSRVNDGPSTSTQPPFVGRYGNCSLAFPFSFGGQISRFWHVWSQITNDPWILQTVAEGLSLELVSQPFQSVIPKNSVSNPTQWEACNKEIISLLEKGAIVETGEPGFVSGIFLIPKKAGGFRPIINLKGLNQFLLYRHFKMEGIQTLRHIVKMGDWLHPVCPRLENIL